jgi:hypothetical protein
MYSIDTSNMNVGKRIDLVRPGTSAAQMQARHGFCNSCSNAWLLRLDDIAGGRGRDDNELLQLFLARTPACCSAEFRV